MIRVIQEYLRLIIIFKIMKLRQFLLSFSNSILLLNEVQMKQMGNFSLF